MAVKKTKKLSGQETVTTINNDQKFPVTDANGKVTLISLTNLKTALLAGMNLNGLYDGIFIMYHRKSDGYPLIVYQFLLLSLHKITTSGCGIRPTTH